MLHQLQHRLALFVRDHLAEELIEVRLEREIDHQLDGVDAALGRELVHRGVRRGGALDDAQPVEVGLARLGADGVPVVAVVCGGHETCARLGIFERLALGVERQLPDFSPLGQLVEGQPGLE